MQAKRGRIYVCAGPGGVGKTTVSAALALSLAASGARVAVVTIDPARRLATALGLEELRGEPHLIEADRLRAAGVETEGELWAMTLDVKSTLDRLVRRLSPDPRTREEILGNRIYRDLSSAVAGSQELSAVARLYELHHEGGFDAIVLDTPPAQNALDFFDAPARLERFLGSRALSLLMGPSGLAARLLGRPALMIFSVFTNVAGVDLLSDLTTFFRSLASTIDGLSERARSVAALLRDPATTRLMLVTAPERGPAAEAISLQRHLRSEGMPFGGLVINRVHMHGLEGHGEEEVGALLTSALGERLAARVASNLADFDVLAKRDAGHVAVLSEAMSSVRPILIPELDEDVQDIAALARVAAYLSGIGEER